MIIEKEPTCPVCGDTLEALDTLMDYDPSCIIYICKGKCSNCGKEFEWEEIFPYKGYKMC